jgi:hypothetical protein
LNPWHNNTLLFFVVYGNGGLGSAATSEYNNLDRKWAAVTGPASAATLEAPVLPHQTGEQVIPKLGYTVLV